MEIYSPGGMFDGSFVQDLDTDHVPSRRRNPVIADVFSRMNYMERRGSGLKKIKEDYHRAANYRPELEPEFYSDTTSFWVTLYNLNYNVPIDDSKQLLENEKTVVSEEQQLFGSETTVVSEQKQLFERQLNELQLSELMKKKVLLLHEQFGINLCFSRADIMKITGTTSSPAGDLIKKMKKENLIIPVTGQGKGKYRFK